MKKSFFILILLVFLLTICLQVFQAKALGNDILVNPLQEAKQGQTVFINLKTEKNLVNPVFEYKGAKYKLFKQANGIYRGFLGLEGIEKPGIYPLNLYDESGNLNQKAQLKVIAKDFPKQNLVVSKQTVGLTATAHEMAEINRMKKTITDTAYFNEMPFNSPTDGCMNSVYGLKRYYNGKFSGNYHKGIDIKAPKGALVRTIAGGKIIFGEFFRLHGGAVAVDHGQGLVSIYIHLSKIDVKQGQIVAAGQKIAEVGSTGFATGPHLHWGLYINGTSVDPMTDWIKPVTMCK